jgi:hypothetical protein
MMDIKERGRYRLGASVASSVKLGMISGRSPCRGTGSAAIRREADPPRRVLLKLEVLHTRRNLRRYVSGRLALQYPSLQASIPSTFRSSGCPNVPTTADTYSHVIQSTDGGPADAIGDVL